MATTKPSASEVLNSVMAAPIPAMHTARLRHQERKVWAGAVRRLLAELGIKGVSVTAPNYSMAHTIDVRLPRVSHEHLGEDYYRMGCNEWCPHCRLSWDAQQHIERVILGAFPDLDDRSDLVSDYFDHCLSIN